ncbi:ankyrin repeat domain-containing protein [Legionella sp. D16C41]|uniref:ankyrin repeat domain-containing protein n=1 Tax=Legionella sp. D16C41 TaxID=3402688 RepID=UPI003AF5A24A
MINLTDEIKKYPLVESFLANNRVSKMELLTLLYRINYITFFSLQVTEKYSLNTCNLVQFLSLINHKDGLNYLSATISKQYFQSMLEAANCFAFRVAASQGYLEVIQCLATQAPKLLPEMIKALSYEAFRAAASQGHLDIVQYLASQAPELLSEMIKAENYFAFREAIANNHYHVANYLLCADKTHATDLYALLSAEQKKALTAERFTTSVADHWLNQNLPKDLTNIILSQAGHGHTFFKPVTTVYPDKQKLEFAYQLTHDVMR